MLHRLSFANITLLRTEDLLNYRHTQFLISPDYNKDHESTPFFLINWLSFKNLLFLQIKVNR